MTSYAPNDGRITSPAPEYHQQQPQQPQAYPQQNTGIEPAPYQQQSPQYLEKGQQGQTQTPLQSPPLEQPQPIYQQQQQPQNPSGYDHFQQDKNMQNNQNPGFQGQNPNQQNPRGHLHTATPLASLQQSPAPVDCPICHVREVTRTEFVSGGTTHVSAIILCCCFCLGCIPYLASWFKDCEHHCGNCGGILAVWHRSGHTEVLAHARS